MKKKKLEISDDLKIHLSKMREILAGISIGDHNISVPQGCDANCGAICRNTCSHYCRQNCDMTCLGSCSDFFASGCTTRMIF